MNARRGVSRQRSRCVLPRRSSHQMPHPENANPVERSIQEPNRSPGVECRSLFMYYAYYIY